MLENQFGYDNSFYILSLLDPPFYMLHIILFIGIIVNLKNKMIFFKG